MEQIIKIGTCLPGWMAEKALGAAIDAGYETGSVNFHMKTFDADFLKELARKLTATIDGRDLRLQRLASISIPWKTRSILNFSKP